MHLFIFLDFPQLSEQSLRSWQEFMSDGKMACPDCAWQLMSTFWRLKQFFFGSSKHELRRLSEQLMS